MANALHTVQSASHRLVFGLDWQPLLGGRPERMAHRLARQRRATHYVVAGATAASAGYAALPRRRLKRAAPLYSAAQNIARRFEAGTIALLFMLDSQRHWVVAVHDGAVIARTDRLCTTAAEAHTILDDLKRAYPHVRVLTPDTGDLPSVDDIGAASGPHSLLQSAGRRSVLPVKMQWLALAVVLTAFVPQARLLFKSAQSAPPELGPEEQAQMWEQAVASVSRAITLHGVHATHMLLENLYALPLQVAGWALINVVCTPQHTGWLCQAQFDRDRAQARNDGLLNAAPSNWSIEFVSIDQARPSWSVVTSGTALAPDKVKSAKDNQRGFQSSLQSIRPAFTQLILGSSQPVPVSAPRDAAGQPLPRPENIPAFASRSLQINGPLRSVSVLLPYVEAVRWNKVSLAVGRARHPGLKESRLTIALTGDIYETTN